MVQKISFHLFVLSSFLPFFGSASASNETRLHEYEQNSFVENNDLYLSDSLTHEGGLSESKFNKVISAVLETMAPDAKEKGLELKIDGFWQNRTVNADMVRMVGKVLVTVYGGIARRPELTANSFAAILCHEVGHGLGGKPDSRRPVFRISTEGQADYFAFSNCLHRVVSKLSPLAMSNETAKLNNDLPALYGFTDDLQSLCSKTTARRPETCEAELLAGLELGHFLAFLKNQAVPSYSTPDKSKVTRTLTGYPPLIQCRLDTYLSGTLLTERPGCWFKK